MSTWFSRDLDSSKFSMWRSAIGILRIDGRIDEAEASWFHEKINKLAFTPEQKKILTKDFKDGIELVSILSKVTDHKDKAFLLHLIRVLGHIDGDFSTEEQAAFSSLQTQILGNLDLKTLENDIVESSYDHLKNIDKDDKRSLLGKGMDFLINLLG